MHGCNPGSTLLVNAEVDSMGGVVDSGVGISHKTSPCRAAIEKVRAELRQEYDVREERRRELEFLEKGGNPLDFKFGNAASVSVQSTSLTDQHHEQFLTSEAKGSFALTASPHGDSAESSGRPGAPSVCEPNSADNLLLFYGDNESLEVEKNSVHLSRKNTITPSEQSRQMVGSQNAKESEDSAIFRPYARRNRTKTNRDYSRGVLKDAKGPLPETNKQRDQNIPPISKLKSLSSNGDIASKDQVSTKPTFMELDGGRPKDVGGISIRDDKLHAVVSTSFKEEEQNVPSQDSNVPGDTDVASDHANAVEDREQLPPVNPEHPHCATAVKSEIKAGFGQPNGLSSLADDRKRKLESSQLSSAVGTNGLDLGSSYTQTSVGIDVDNDSDTCIDKVNIFSNGDAVEPKPECEKELNLVSTEMLKERNENDTASSAVDDNNDQSSRCQNYSFSGGLVKYEADLLVSCSVMQELKEPSDVKGKQQNEHSLSKSDIKSEGIFSELPKSDVEQVYEKQQVLMESSNTEIPQTTTTERDATAASGPLACPAECLKLANKAYEDSILDEACIIQAKRKRIAELSACTLPPQSCRSSHWDFVLEEMAWLANDFGQERFWKLSAASQLCRQAAFASRKRLERQTKYWKMRGLAHDIAKSVKQFWHRAELLLDSDYIGLGSRIVSSEGVQEKTDMLIKSEDLDGQHPNKSVQGYAVRFVKYNRSLISSPQTDYPATPDRISGSYSGDLLWGEQLTEETLFYTVPATAMEVYRKSIKSHFEYEKIGTSAQEEVETSTHYAVTEFGSEELYEDDEGELTIHYMPGAFERNKSLKYAQKKQKSSVKSYTPRISETGINLADGHCMVAASQSTLIGKRFGSLHVGTIPTKRVRTATRQRVLTPFGPGVTGVVHAQNKTDASSGDTDSFQDDQSTLHGGSLMQKSMEVESVGEFEKHLSYDYAETSIKSRKKKAKHMGSAYDQGWQMDKAVYNDQKDHSKRRSGNHYFESNGTSGLSPHIGKKPKRMNKSVESTYDSVSPLTVSIPSPTASHMSNMPSQNRLIKLITGSGRDKGRKPKTLKMSPVQPTTGIPWSLFEDQALVVLVHDMGPNWELISDAMNSTLHFKCIFRKPKECKERHKTLMERSCGDGADSADDSGSSQSYPSTLPGIPKGSARQLFQRLQGPMEEDTLKSHFDKIIKLGQKQQLQKNQNCNPDPKQIVPAHNSHAVALSQVPNYVNGVFLTPLDLSDTTASVPDILPHSCQGTHGNGLTLLNQGLSLPTSGVNSTIQGSSSMVMGNNSPSPSGPVATSMRDSRHGFSRASLPGEEQQRIQQYNQMLSRNVQQSALSAPSSHLGNDRVHMLPGLGMCGISRSMPVSRPGIQGIASSSTLSSGSMISTSMVGNASPVNMHTGAASGPGNSVLRPRDALHVMRPGHNTEHQRQMVPDLQMQVTQGNGQGIPAFNGLSSAFNNQTTPGTAQPFPGHGQQKQSHLSSPHHSHLQGTNNAANSQQQVYAIRLAKERQLQHRYLQHQHQFVASSTLMPPDQLQSQLAVSLSLQNSSPIQSQGSPQPMSPLAVTPSSPLTSISSQNQQKHHLPQHGISRTPAASGLSNQAMKQRQKQAQQQQFQQPGRQHPNQRQHALTQQQAKLLKGIGRGTMAVHQNIPVDPSHLNGISIPPGSQTGDKGDQIAQIMQGQGLYSGSCLNSSEPSKPFVSQSSNNSQLQQRVHSASTTSQSLQTQDNQNHTSGQRVLHQSRSLQSESPNISQAGPSQVEQKPANAKQVCVGSAAPLVRMNMANAVSNNSTIHQLKASELSRETNTQNPTAKVGLLGGPLVSPVQHSPGKEPSSPINLGLGPRQLSGSFPPHVRNTGAQRQQQLQTALHQSSAHHLSQQSFQTSEQQDQQQEQDQHSPEHMTLQHQSKQELQAAQNNLYRGPPNSEVE